MALITKVRSHLFFLALLLVIVSCRNGQTVPQRGYENVPQAHFPTDSLHNGDLQHYVLAYCWRSLERDATGEGHTDIVVSRGDGRQPSTITSPRPPRLSPVNLGCFGLDHLFRTGEYALAWRPNRSQLTMAIGPANLPDSFYFVTIQDGPIVDLPEQMIEGIDKYLYGPYYELAWSPTGAWLATRSLGVNTPGLDDVWLYNPDTDQARRMTDLSRTHDPIKKISWSANGEYLAVSYSQNLAGVGIIRLDDLLYTSISNKNQTTLSNWRQDVFDPRFRFQSQLDGKSRPVWIDRDQRVVFTAPTPDGRVTLFVVKADGTDLQELLPGLPGLVNLPIVAPDGSKLAFVRFPGWAEMPDRAEIAVADLATRNITSLAVLPAPANGDMLYISGLDWSPDGKYLAFSSNHEGQSDIYVMSADGQAWINLTDKSDGDAVNPVWRP